MPNESNFKNHKEYLDWYRNYRKENIEQIREYKREYLKKWRLKNGYNRDNARIKIWRMLKSGNLKKQSCFVCGKKEVQAHHEDYSKPLDIKWLCVIHHKEADKKLRQKL